MIFCVYVFVIENVDMKYLDFITYIWKTFSWAMHFLFP